MKTKNFFDVGTSDKYRLVDFSFENVNVTDEKDAFDASLIEGTKVGNVIINGISRWQVVITSGVGTVLAEEKADGQIDCPPIYINKV